MNMKSLFKGARTALFVAVGAISTTCPLVSTSLALADEYSTGETLKLADLESEIGQIDDSVLLVNANQTKAPTVQERLDAINAKLAEMEASIESVADTAGDKSIVKSGSSKSTMKVSGRVHFDAWGFDANDDTITNFNEGNDPENRLGFRRLRFGVKGNVADNMLYKIEMEFAGGNASEFRDAYLGWTDLPFLQTLLLG